MLRWECWPCWCLPWVWRSRTCSAVTPDPSATAIRCYDEGLDRLIEPLIVRSHFERRPCDLRQSIRSQKPVEAFEIVAVDRVELRELRVEALREVAEHLV